VLPPAGAWGYGTSGSHPPSSGGAGLTANVLNLAKQNKPTNKTKQNKQKTKTKL
jgi:hypothetical protein